MMKGFKEFMLRGNVVELAVAVVMGAAFTAVVTAFVKDLLTPLIAAIVGAPDFSAISVSINGSKIDDRRFHERARRVSDGRRRRLLLRGDAGERADGANAPRRGAARSDDQEVPGMPERDRDCRATLRVLHLAPGLGSQRGLKPSRVDELKRRDGRTRRAMSELCAWRVFCVRPSSS